MTIISPDKIRGQLNRILGSSGFITAQWRRQFLRYLVEQSLKGQSNRIKQYTIAVEAFGFGDAYTLDYQDLDNPLEKALFCAKKAIALDSRSQESHANMALIRFLLKQHKAAIAEAENAIPLNPNSAYVVSFSGWIIGLSGELDRGRRIIDEMDNYKPNTPGWLRLIAYIYHLDKGEYDQALHEARRFRMPDELAWDPICRAAAAGHLGKAKVAAAAYNELVKKFPAVAGNIEDTIRIYIHFELWVKAILDGLALAEVAYRHLFSPEEESNLTITS